MTQMLKQFASARAVGTPLIGIRSADPENTMAAIQRISKDVPILMWNCISGARHRNEAGEESLNAALDGADIMATQNATEMTDMASKLFSGTILFMVNSHRFLDKHDFTQALWNLRDVFKSTERTIVLLGPEFQFPAELQQDVLVLDEPLPDEEELKAIVKETVSAAELPAKVIASIDVNRAVDALRGLAAFPAEQATAMSISPQGLDIEGLWERKRKLISATDALSVYKGKETFKDIGGCEQIKKFMRGIIAGKEAPKCVVFIDEGEKQFSGSSSDWVGDGGVAKDKLATTLQFMEDMEADGVIFVGPPGAAKSAIAKATGNEAGIPTIILDLGAASGGTVGSSEMKIRNAYKTITAIGSGRVYFVMTCNKSVALPPELVRRFSSGTFYFPLPDEDSNFTKRTEKALIWAIYITKYNLEKDALSGQLQEYTICASLNDAGWTGAEIRNCCRLAYRQSISLKDASAYIVPVYKSSPQVIETLRREASGRYLSAHKVGTYDYRTPIAEPPTQRRKFAQETK